MMEQYWEYRRQLTDDTLLLFRLGDFYELFHDDAKEGARLLGITLTKRQDYPMAGIPYHAAESYIGKLLQHGKKVAIADQVETPKPGKLVERALTRILTPGTALEENQLEPGHNHYLVSLDFHRKEMRLAWLDLSTGDFQVASHEDPTLLLPVLNSLQAREIVLPEESRSTWNERYRDTSWYEPLQALLAAIPATPLSDEYFGVEEGCRVVQETLGVLNLEGFGLDRSHPALGCAGALIHYAKENLCQQPTHLNRIKRYRPEGTLLLDPATQRNLEIFHSASHTREGSLIHAMDATHTAAGRRLLEQYLNAPSMDPEELQRRQQCVEEGIHAAASMRRLRETLKQVRDINRILTRLQSRIRNPRELGGIRETLNQLPDIRNELEQLDDGELKRLAERIHPCDPLRECLNQALADELPGKLQDGGLIHAGYDETLDHLRSLTTDNKTWISDLEAAEQKRTGIKNLKIKYNGAFGYFIEVTKSNLSLVPDNYIRKQTMTNAERYYTEALKQKEKEILNAEEKAIAREDELFQYLVERVIEWADVLGETAAALSELDVFFGWAQIARDWDYSRPQFESAQALSIDQGRHPVVEQMLQLEKTELGSASSQSFVPNDTWLDTSDHQIALITGPNMAGKSTYIRQVALLTLMAQVGCWVPAKTFRLGVVDRIFSRVGASDELARGNSTFMVEMNETANILNNATDHSLIILDEIGRGTSTYDGLSIAWSVIEHLHGESGEGPRTLFATHYHELTRLAQTLARVHNYCVSVKEWNEEIIFVRQVVKGAADRSYGIQVARLAGLPPSVIDRAKTILQQLEANQTAALDHQAQETSSPRYGSRKHGPSATASSTPSSETPQLSLFENW